jgi:RNA-directed DNA polymerase
LLKVDFRDFFPSIAGKDVAKVLKKNFSNKAGLLAGVRDLDVIRRIVCKDDRLTIGAPSSPAVSNAVMYEFDLEWAARSKARGVIFSRYADDLYFSTNKPNVLAPLLEELRRDLRRRGSPSLQINDQKTVFTSRKRRRLVTGLVITPEGRLSLGRKRKRYIKSLLFRYTRKAIGDEDVAYLRGFIAYVRSVEPSFFETLKRKYGEDSLNAVLRSH